MTAPVMVDERDLTETTWDDPAHGTIRWKTLLSAGLTATEGLVCGIALMQPGEHFALHSHAEPEVYFGLEGEGDVMIDGVAHRLRPGVALYIPGNAVHGVPKADQPLRWFYTFARNSFDEITYNFAPGIGPDTTRQA